MDTPLSGKDTQMEESPRPGRIQAFLHLTLLIILFLAIALLLNMLGIALAAAIQGVSLQDMASNEGRNLLFEDTTSLRIITLIGSGLSMLVTAWALPRVIRADTWSFLSANRLASWKWILACLTVFVLLIPTMEQLLSWNMSIDLSQWSTALDEWVRQADQASNDAYNVIIGSGSSTDLIINLLLMAAIPAIAEEFLFRGALLNILNGLFKNIHVAIAVSAVVFAVVHFQMLKVFPMLILAVAFGYLVYWTGSVWTSVLAHFINNALAVFALHSSEGQEYEEVLNQGQTFDLWIVVLTALMALGLAILIHRSSPNKLQRFYE